jgi:hypothetical protein
MQIRLAIIAAWAGMLALVQTDLAQAAYFGSAVSKPVEVKAEVGMGVDNWARNSVDHQIQISFREEVREFQFPHGIILNQTHARNRRLNSNHSQSYSVDVRNRHGCYHSTRICTRWIKVHRHRP